MPLTAPTVQLVDDDPSFLTATVAFPPGERLRCKDVFLGKRISRAL